MFKGFIFLLQKICNRDIILEGRDKLTKMLIYAFKLFDSMRSILRKQPIYGLEKIGCINKNTKLISKKPDK